MSRYMKTKLIFITVGAIIGFLIGLALIWMFNNYGAY